MAGDHARRRHRCDSTRWEPFCSTSTTPRASSVTSTEPLLVPADDERDGYVPNVVYSCGSMIFGGMLVLPYGFSDIGTRIATIEVDALLARLTS